MCMHMRAHQSRSQLETMYLILFFNKNRFIDVNNNTMNLFQADLHLHLHCLMVYIIHRIGDCVTNQCPIILIMTIKI